MKIKIATWNINSIRIRIDQLKSLFEESKLDIVLLQEIKCQEKDFPFVEIKSIGLNYYFVGQKSYNGVAIISKYPMDIELKSLSLYNTNNDSFNYNDQEARYIETTTTINGKFFRLASIYIPNGQSLLENGQKLEESQRFIYKIKFYERIKERIKELNSSLKDEYIFFGGDYNVAQEEIDLHNPKAQNGEIGFHPIERENLREIQKCGLSDAFRHKNGNKISYTWWDYRTKAYPKNLGWRIDYMFVSDLVLKSMTDCYVDLKTREKNQPSDHAPLIVDIEI